MHLSRCNYHKEGRLRAAFFSCAALVMLLVLSGCGGAGALRSTMQAVVPWSGDVSQRAAALPYATVDMSVNGNGGLLVLAELSHGNAYFQSASRGVIVLRHGNLYRTAGLAANLVMTRVYRQDQALQAAPWRLATAGKPFHYQVQRQWRGAEGVLHADTARATLTCEQDTTQIELPLATLGLQKCRVTLAWSGGAHTQSILWRHPDDHRLWAVHTVPWPGGPEIEWQVARPWW